MEKDVTDGIETRVELGLSDERRILNACGKADDVLVYAYGRTHAVGWKGVANKVAKARNLQVFSLDGQATVELVNLAERSMVMHVTVQDGTAWISAAKGEASVEVQNFSRG